MSSFVKGGGGVAPKQTFDATTITAGTENQVIDAGTYLKGDLTVLGDANLIPENIKQGVNIFGLLGTFCSGDYVWKRYKIHQITATQITDSVSPTIVQLSSDTIDLSTVDASWFIGMTGNYGTTTIEFTSATKVAANGVNRNFTYDPTTQKLSITAAWKINDWAFNPFNKLFDYSVDNDPEKYPDGGEQGGYWYEKVAELPLFGAKKVAIDTFTFSSDTDARSFSVTHSLGEQPKAWLIIGELSTEYSSGYTILYASGKLYDSTIIATSCLYDADMSDLRSGYFYVDPPTDTQINGNSNSASNYKFRAGIEYTLITMA